MVERFGQRVEQGQARRGAGVHCDCHCAVEGDDGRRGARHEAVVQAYDLGPVGIGAVAGFGMDGGDGRLNCVGTGGSKAKRVLGDLQPVLDLRVVPQFAVLIFEQDQIAGGCASGGRTCIVKEHEADEPKYLGLVSKEFGQRATEPKRDAAQVATDELRAPGCVVAFIEDQVDDREDRLRSVTQRFFVRNFERHLGRLDLFFGPNEALSHGRRADQKGAGDLFRFEARDGPQRQRDPRFRGEGRMAAGEDQPKHVVSDRSFDLRRVDDMLQRRQPLKLLGLFGPQGAAPQLIDRLVPGRRDQPRARIVRHAVDRPSMERGEEGLLKRVFGKIEVTNAAHEPGQYPARMGPDHPMNFETRLHERTLPCRPRRRMSAVAFDMHNGSNLDRAISRGRDSGRDTDRFVQIGDVDQIEPAELLLRFGERAIGRHQLAVPDPNGCRRAGRLQRVTDDVLPGRLDVLGEGHIFGDFCFAFLTPGLAVAVFVVVDEEEILHCVESMSNETPADRQGAPFFFAEKKWERGVDRDACASSPSRTRKRWVRKEEIDMTYDHGRFVWFELVAQDRSRAVDFYGEVIGWKVQTVPMPGGEYAMAMRGENAVGGFAEPQTAGIPAHWVSYVSVKDVDAAAKKVIKFGGKSLADAFDVPSVGRMQPMTDPSGAHFYLFRNANGDDAVLDGPGSFHWNELLTVDPEAAVTFYQQAFGYTHETMDMPDGTYFVLKNGDKLRAGVTKQAARGPALWLQYVTVEDCDATVAAAKAHDGKVTVAATDIPSVGRLAVIQDPVGAMVGVIKPAG